MGEAGRDALRVGFDRTVKLEFRGATVNSDAGLFPYHDLDDAVLPAQMADGSWRTIHLRCVTRPDETQKMLLRLGLTLPQRLRRIDEVAQM